MAEDEPPRSRWRRWRRPRPDLKLDDLEAKLRRAERRSEGRDDDRPNDEEHLTGG